MASRAEVLDQMDEILRQFAEEQARLTADLRAEVAQRIAAIKDDPSSGVRSE